MSMEKLVDKYFNEYINETFKHKLELQALFKNHERKPLLIKNIVKELSKKQYSVLICDINVLKNVTKSFCRLYCLGVINNKEQNIKTNAQFVDQFGKKVETEVEKAPELPEGVLEVERHPGLTSI